MEVVKRANATVKHKKEEKSRKMQEKGELRENIYAKRKKFMYFDSKWHHF